MKRHLLRQWDKFHAEVVKGANALRSTDGFHFKGRNAVIERLETYKTGRAEVSKALIGA
jgi:hypothetical protein